MARVTVEDCIPRVPNRFDLVVLAAQRARDIGAGARLTLERDDDKNPVVALREIAEGSVTAPELEEAVLKGLQKFVEVEEPEEETELLKVGDLSEALVRDAEAAAETAKEAAAEAAMEAVTDAETEADTEAEADTETEAEAEEQGDEVDEAPAEPE